MECLESVWSFVYRWTILASYFKASGDAFVAVAVAVVAAVGVNEEIVVGICIISTCSRSMDSTHWYFL